MYNSTKADQPRLLQESQQRHADISCPSGLEYLAQLDQLVIQRNMEFFPDVESNNKFAIKDSMGEQCYFAYEESDFWKRMICGVERDLVCHVLNNMKKEVFRMTKTHKCCAGNCYLAVFEQCAHEIEVETVDGQKLGSVIQRRSFGNPYYAIKNETGQTVLKIKGGFCCFQLVCCQSDVAFQILDEEAQVGSIRRVWTGTSSQAFMKSSNYEADFSKDWDVKIKTVIIAAVMLIDMMYFPYDGA